MKPLTLVMQAFGPFATREVIDFRKLGETPLFLINGVTGSGKSSILDAICFALYGQTTDTARDGSSMRCDYAEDDTLTELIFDFALGDYQYRIRRTPKQTQQKKRGEGTVVKLPEAQLWRADVSVQGDSVFADGECDLLVAKKTTDATKLIVDITGLSAEQFRQVMVLPQGKFRELLLAESSEREAIFSQLFQTHIYKKIEDALKEQSSGIRREREQLHNKEAGLLESAGFSERSDLLKEQTDLIPQLESHRANTQKLTQDYERCQQALQKAEQLQQRLQEQEQLQLQLEQKTYQEKAAEVQGWQLQVAQGRKADELKPLHLQRQELLAQLQLNQQQLQEQAKSLTDLNSAVASAHADVIDAEKNAESVHQLQRDLQELERLQLQVERISNAQQQVQQELGHVSRAEKTLLQQQADVSEKESLVAQLDIQLSNDRLLVEPLSGFKLQLQQLKHSGVSLKKLQQLRGELQNNQYEQQRLQTGLANKQQALEQQKTAMQHCELQWHRRQAAVLAQSLKLNEPCPVCGSCEHPSPAIDSSAEGTIIVDKAMLDAERKKTQLIEAECYQLSQQRYALEQLCPTIEQHIASLVQELAEKADFSLDDMRAHYAACQKQCERLDLVSTQLSEQEGRLTDTKSALQQFLQKIELSRQALDHSRQQWAAANERLKVIEADVIERYRQPGVLASEQQQLQVRIESLQKAVVEAHHTYQQLQHKQVALAAINVELKNTQEDLKKSSLSADHSWLEALGQSDFGDEAEYSQVLMAPEQRDQLETNIQQYQQQYDQLQGRLNQLAADLEGESAPLLEPLSEALSKSLELKASASAALTLVEGRSVQLNCLEAKLDSSRKESERLDQRYAVLGTLSDVANGQNSKKLSLQRFVLSVLLDDVLVQASQRLQLMSQGRYQLLRKEERAKGNKASGLELEVEDSYAGKRRPVATLSGGESFMAALSMALGLSDVVQAYSGGIKLDTLFIDEGFGSLDSESLELALRTLLDLQASGRTIGIISHVSELKEQMSQRIDVLASQQGSRIRLRASH